MKLSNFFKRRMIWRIGIYRLPSIGEIFNLNRFEPLGVIGEHGFRKSVNYASVCADPFLFVQDDSVFVFFERKTDYDHGEIHAVMVSPGGEFQELGCVLREKHHLSYPQVFRIDNEIYMLPETATAGHVRLYRAKAFPREWELVSTLTETPYLDPTIYKDGEDIYMFGTSREGVLDIFRIDNHGNAVFMQTARVQPEFSRCGGGFIKFDGTRFRVAQTGSLRYGEGIAFLRVESVAAVYKETVQPELKLFNAAPWWAECGHHHLSVACCSGVYYVAVDGQSYDRYSNTLMHAAISATRSLSSKGFGRWSPFGRSRMSVSTDENAAHGDVDHRS